MPGVNLARLQKTMMIYTVLEASIVTFTCKCPIGENAHVSSIEEDDKSIPAMAKSHRTLNDKELPRYSPGYAKMLW
jgi:hypothetical protein